MGLINSITNEITMISGYLKDDLIKQNISVLMPKIIADLHNEILINDLNSQYQKYFHDKSNCYFC